MGNDPSKVLQDQLFEIKFTAKQLDKESQKARQREQEHKLKLKKAIQQGDFDRAKICAENALREKQQSLSLMKLSSRMEAVAQRVNQALVMGKVTKSMEKTVKGMDQAFKSMNVEKISRVMDDFTAAFDEVDVKTSVMGQELDRTMDSTVQSDDVTNLMQMVADEHGLTLSDHLKAAPKSAPLQQQQAVQQVSEEDELGQRLRNLG